MNSYLRYRTIVNPVYGFSEKAPIWYYAESDDRTPIRNAKELDVKLKEEIEKTLKSGSSALMLSSGIDSAILASYLPEGTQTYTLHCRAKSSIDETSLAKAYAEKNHLKHTVIEIDWEDYEAYSLPLMQRKGYPIHSIEVQIYKAALRARQDGIKNLIFGETADIIYGGHSKLLARDWTREEFIKRFSFVDPQKVLKQPMEVSDPIDPYVQPNGLVDVFAFLNGFEYGVSLGFYTNACMMGGAKFVAPYSRTILGEALDLDRIRKGEGKYIVRELYKEKYPDQSIPEKTPLPRPMTEWLANWEGPQSSEFIRDHISELTGDQKWYVYALDQFMQSL